MVTSTAATGIGSIFQTGSSNAQSSQDVFSKNANMYLSLFLTQLKNQDPTQPFDTAQMTQQLSQLNSSQQLINTNKNLESLIAINKTSQASSLASFINKNIEYLGDTFYNESGGTQKFSYVMSGDPVDSNIEIRDADNNLVLKVPADKASGSHDYTWDGKDSLGNVVPAGTYKVSVVTRDQSNKFSTVGTFLRGTVTGIDFSTSKEPVVFIGKDSSRVGVDLSRISSISEAAIPTTNTSL